MSRPQHLPFAPQVVRNVGLLGIQAVGAKRVPAALMRGWVRTIVTMILRRRHLQDSISISVVVMAHFVIMTIRMKICDNSALQDHTQVRLRQHFIRAPLSGAMMHSRVLQVYIFSSDF